MVYICACAAPELPPERLTSSRMMEALHYAQTGAVIFFRNQSGQISRIGQRSDELFRVGPLAIHLAPVFIGILGAKLTNAGA